jgi:tetratricopeptide (TPR) repeat protein
MLAMLVDDGHLVQRGGQWVVADGALDEVAVPPSVSALLTARLDRLSPDERWVIERAAVEGKEFHAGSVAALLDADDRPGLPGHLRTLIRRELIRPDRADLPGEEGYRFRHQLIRDAVYEAIPKRARADLHRAFAAWLAARGGDHEEIVAYHLEHSYLLRAELGPVDEDGRRDGRRAAERLTEAGRRAIDRQDYRAAENLLERAIALLPRPDALRIDAAIMLGNVHHFLSDFQRALDVLDESAEDARALHDADRETIVELGRASIFHQVSDEFTPEEQLEIGYRAVRQFEESGQWANLAVAWESVADGYWALARWSSMRAPLEQAADALIKAGAPPGRELALRVRMLSAMYWGDAPVPEAVEVCRRLQAEAADTPLLWARTSLFLAAFLALQGMFDEADELIGAGRATLEQLGSGSWVASLAFCSTPVGLASGRLDDAERDLRNALGLLEGTGERGWSSTLASELALLLFERGEVDEAEQWAIAGRDAVLPGDISADSFWRMTLGRIHSAREEHDEALRLAREGVAMFRDTDELNHQGDSLVSLAWVAERAGRRDEAEAALRDAIDVYERKQNTFGAKRARDRLAELTAG